jgi:aryl-alcohol dehydrogenase-like predicted oxidoreductase
METIRTRPLGRSGLEVSMIGMGCWAIGGKCKVNGEWSGWGPVDDAESIRALQRAFELGVNFYDTADAYGCGHSEQLIADALGSHRDEIVIATKVGNTFIEKTKECTGRSGDPDYIRQACEASLRRLNTDRIDLYQFHVGNYEMEKAGEARDTFEELVAQGKVKHFGWSTDDPERAAFFAESPHCVAIQQGFNLFGGNPETLAVCERENLASILRGPLAKGLLTGKFTKDSTPPNDVRSDWDLKAGAQAKQLDVLDTLRGILTADGRTLTQAALGWLWARSPNMIPIPGFKTVDQVEENVGACRYGPLSPKQMTEIETLLGKSRL